MKSARLALIAPVWIAITIAVIWLGVRYSGIFAGVLCSIAILVPFVYVLVSTLYPAWGDTKCPQCGKPALRRPDPKVLLGVVCDACGFADKDMYRAYLDEMK